MNITHNFLLSKLWSDADTAIKKYSKYKSIKKFYWYYLLVLVKVKKSKKKEDSFGVFENISQIFVDLVVSCVGKSLLSSLCNKKELG